MATVRLVGVFGVFLAVSIDLAVVAVVTAVAMATVALVAWS